MSMQVINPATGEKGRLYESHSEEEIVKIIDATDQCWQSWRLTTFEERSKLMLKAAAFLRNNKHGYAELMAEEMGKPIRDGASEAEKCAWACEYYANEAVNFLKSQVIGTDASKSYISYQPIGIVLAVMPWNFPFWQVIRFAAPALMAGNAGILKHASNVPGCALAIEELFQKAGFPKDVFRTLLIGSKEVEKVIENKRVKAVTLTGSTPAGKAVAAKAGEMLKKTVLELGGSDPYVILDDADLSKSANVCAKSRLINNGQSCIAAKRFIVVESVKQEFEQLLVKEMAMMQYGDPLLQETQLGPMAREDLREELHDQVNKSVRSGAKILLGGKTPNGKGAFYPPTVLTDVAPGMPAYGEELFGPVAAVISAKNEKEAIRIANDTSFGLGAAVFTQDIAKGSRIAEKELQAGCCFVNDFVKSDPRLPFGGIKESGYGRELGAFGIKEFVNIKSVYVK